MPTQPTSTEESPFDGVHFRYEPERRSPFLAYYYTSKLQADGKLKSVAVRRRFETSLERTEWARGIARTLVEQGRKSRSLDPSRAERWAVADALLEKDVDPVEVVTFWLQSRAKASGSADRGIRCSEVLREYVDYRRRDAAWPWGQFKAIYERFNRIFGAMGVAQFGREIHLFEDWVEGLPFADWTKKNHFSRVGQAFRWAYRRKLIDMDPFSRASRPRSDLHEVEVISAVELERIFAANFERAGTCAKLALSALAGMRTEAVARLEWRDLQFGNRAIETPGWKTKKKRRQLIQGLPEVVWKWLERADAADFAPACENFRSREHLEEWKRQRKTAWMHEKSDALERSGLFVPKAREDPARGIYARALPRNWARHSFVTCHATAFENLPLTAELVSHALDLATIKSHYLGVVLKDEAEAFFAVDPEKVRSGLMA